MRTESAAPVVWARRAGLGELARNALRARAAPAVIIALSVALCTSSLTLGFSVDEYFQRVALSDTSHLQGMARAPWKLFTFSSPAVNQLLMEQGIFPWWTDPEFVISFFRPLTSLTLYLDHLLWRDNALLFHVHNIFWYALLLGSVWCVYREFRLTAKLPAFALLLYAIDDARSQVVGWVSLRNAPLALIPAFLALVFHHRYRSGRGTLYGWLAALGLALGLLGGEVAIAVCGYLFAYAAFLDRGTLWRRACSLLPYLAVLVPYRVMYNALGYGALHSGMYVDPVREPLAFLYCVASHLPVLLFAQFALPPAELWEPYALIASWLQPTVYVLVLLGLLLLGKLLWPLLRESAEARFWALGSVLATLPMCATFPADRLLIATSLGGAALLSNLLLSLFEPQHAPRLRRGLGYTLLFVHCVFAPLFFTVRARDIVLTERLLSQADRSISRETDIQHKTLIMVNPVLSAFGVYFPVYREAKGLPLPRSFRHLASAESALLVERVDARTLKLRPEGGFLFSISQQVFRSQFRKFRGGERIALSDMKFTVTEVLPDGRPAEVLVQLDRVLEDPSLQWVKWGKRAYVPFTPPKLGERVVLPKVDALPLMFEASDSDG